MMQEILAQIGTGGFTLSMLAAGVGISNESLANRLALMERMGHIAREPCSDSPGACSHCCAYCAYNSRKDAVVRYVLTEKGRRLCRLPERYPPTPPGSSPLSPTARTHRGETPGIL